MTMTNKTPKPKREFGIHFGALCEPIAKQLRTQNLKLNKPRVEVYQRRVEAINLLFIHGYISPSVTKTARIRLLKNLSAELLKENQ